MKVFIQANCLLHVNFTILSFSDKFLDSDRRRRRQIPPIPRFGPFFKFPHENSFSALWLLLTPADHPYIQSLPTVEDLSTHLPVFWPDGFARQFPDWLDLRGSFDLADFATIVIHKIFHIWEDTDLPPITVEHVKWAISIVWTRFDS